MTHLAISGELGSGKSAVARRLAEVLGYRVVSTGDIQRDIARSLELSTLETNLLAESDQAIDQRVDGVTRELGATEDHIIFDSRMAWHMVPTAFKVHLLVDHDVAAHRMFARVAAAEDYASLADAARGADERYLSERKRFLRTYGVDVARLRNYDLVLDSTAATVAQVCDAIVTAFERPAVERTFGLFVDPARVTVSARVAESWAAQRTGGDEPTALADPLPRVVYQRPVVLALDGLDRIADAAAATDPLLEVQLLAEADEIAGDGRSAADLVSGAVASPATGA